MNKIIANSGRFSIVLARMILLIVALPVLSGADQATPLLVMPPILAARDRPDTTGPPGSPSWWHPRPGASWQWQLSGVIDTSVDAEMFDIDLFDTPQQVIDRLHARGRTVICYFSAGSYENWRPDADRYPGEILGRDLDGWPGERWVDIRRTDLLAPILKARLDLAVSKKCDGVEPDNVDGYTNDTGFPLSATDQLRFNRWLAAMAHERGLSIGLKNNLGQVASLVGDFDWALNEQCFQFDECDALLPFVQAGKAVFGVEYSGETGTFCPRANTMNFDWLKKKVTLGSWRIPCR